MFCFNHLIFFFFLEKLSTMMISSSFIPFKYSLAQKNIFFGSLFWTSFLWPTSLLLPEEFLVTFLIGYVCWQIPQFIVIWVSVYFCFSFKWYFYKIFFKILMDFFSFSTFEQFYSFLSSSLCGFCTKLAEFLSLFFCI